MAPQQEMMAELLIAAGADLNQVAEWMPVGRERAARKRHRD